jgi:protein-L-isoaspartate(D-aspartate) O-methyltransferase
MGADYGQCCSMGQSLDDMLEYDLRRRGIADERVLEAFRRVDRKRFVPTLDQWRAYEDCPLHLSYGQTISQPYMVALMTVALALKGTERVLEVGTGSGYQTALLACLAREVYTVERIEYLATTAEDRLVELGFTNVRYRLGDGSLGWPECAPYERIIVTAACPRIPPPLVAQLAEGGTLAAPVGSLDGQDLIVATKKDGKLRESNHGPCVFVKLIGSQAFSADNAPHD